MDVRESALLSAAVTITLIAEKAKYQAGRTTDEVCKISLLETREHCVAALKIIEEARKAALDMLPCSAECGGGRHVKSCPYAAALEEYLRIKGKS